MEKFKIAEDVAINVEGRVPSSGEVFSVKRKTTSSETSSSKKAHLETKQDTQSAGKKQGKHKGSKKQFM